MRLFGIVVTAVILFANSIVHGQIKRTSVPLGEAVEKSLAKGSLLGEGARPFHIHVSVSEPENPASPYQGTIEEWWGSPLQWRREVTAKVGMRQTIVVVRGSGAGTDSALGNEASGREREAGAGRWRPRVCVRYQNRRSAA